jgi:hypothetical protein
LRDVYIQRDRNTQLRYYGVFSICLLYRKEELHKEGLPRAVGQQWFRRVVQRDPLDGKLMGGMVGDRMLKRSREGRRT